MGLLKMKNKMFKLDPELDKKPLNESQQWRDVLTPSTGSSLQTAGNKSMNKPLFRRKIGL